MADMDIPEAPEPPKRHTGFFHSGEPSVQPDLRAFTSDIGNLSRRLRLLEESFTNIRRALQVTEQNMLSKNKAFSTEIKTLASDISDIKQEIADMKEKMFEFAKELRESAKRDEVKVLEKYISFWDPVKFVTQNDVEAIVHEIIKKTALKKKEK